MRLVQLVVHVRGTLGEQLTFLTPAKDSTSKLSQQNGSLTISVSFNLFITTVTTGMRLLS
jgi:hypothetical protein